MFSDEQNLTFLKFLSPIIDEFEPVNQIFQCDDPNPVKLHDDLSSFVKSMMARVVLPGYATPDNKDWDEHILHVRACGLGSAFFDFIERCSLNEEDKTALLERCR